MMQQVNKVIFSFFGPPGSGKGTLAERLARELSFEVLSTGNLCRKNIADQTEIGKSLSLYLDKGHLIPDELITDMVGIWLKDAIKKNHPIILDGFPRTKGQIKLFLNFLKEIPGSCFRVMHIKLSEGEIIKRLSLRLVCENKDCQAVYNSMLIGQQTVCEACGSLLVKRRDDDQEVVKERLRQYPAYAHELLTFYRSVGQHVEEIDVVDMTPEQVYNTFLSMI